MLMYEYMLMHDYIYEMNNSNDTRDMKEEQGLSCFNKLFTLPMKCIVLLESGFRLIVCV
jgi:hypothetical protein